jgi:hypothetical protein
MPCVGFEPTIPAFERAKTFHALDGAATVIGLFPTARWQISTFWINRSVVKIFRTPHIYTLYSNNKIQPLAFCLNMIHRLPISNLKLKQYHNFLHPMSMNLSIYCLLYLTAGYGTQLFPSQCCRPCIYFLGHNSTVSDISVLLYLRGSN